LRNLVAGQRWLAEQTSLAAIPAVKVQHFAEEAKTLDAARMQAREDERLFSYFGARVSPGPSP
jgi:hypothetical protein